MTEKFDAILEMLDLGCAIVPIVERDKKPAFKGGVKAASKDRKKIEELFRRRPELNYGIATGARSGIFVLDVDGDEGISSLKKLVKTHGRLPETLMVLTKRGAHIYFRASKGRIPNSAGKIAPGIDVRGDGGYSVGPGSTHPSGFVYRIRKGNSPENVKISAAPKWLLDEVIATPNEPATLGAPQVISPPDVGRAQAYGLAAYERELDRLRKAPEHQRNDTLNISAFRIGQLAAHGLLDPVTVAKALTKVARAIGLCEDEIDSTIKSGLNAGRKHPRNLAFLNGGKPKPDAEPSPVQGGEDLTRRLAKRRTNDTDNASRFAHRFGHKVIFTKSHGWMTFDGKRWCPDSLFQCIELAKKTARLIRKEAAYLNGERERAERVKFSELSLSKASLDRMLDLAKGLLTVEPAKLDADPWLLNTLTGTYRGAPVTAAPP